MVSYLYFLIYELLSPFIELAGVTVTVVSYIVDLINVRFMIAFFLGYAVYGVILTLTAFFARIQTIDLEISVSDCIKAISLCLIEVAGLRFILAFVRATALVGYNKKKLNWGRIERKKINVS